MTPVERVAEALWASVDDKGIDGRLYRHDCDYLARAAFESIDEDELAAVTVTHRIECTGIGEVTCYGCRERGWMSRTEYHHHLARALKEHLTRGDENDE